MATAKQDARRVLEGLPEEASLEDIQYHLYVLQRIPAGQTMGDIVRGAVPFMFALAALLALIITFPGIVTWLPYRK